jgi:hypothetical protein
LTGTSTIIFSGDKKAGTLTLQGYIDTGTYTVDGKTVHFEFHAAGYDYNFVYDGQFDDKDKMSGTTQYYANSVLQDEGTWQATRVATSAETGKLPMANRSVKELLK